MLVQIPKVLNAEQVQQFRKELETVQWSDGRGSAGYLSAQVKQNLQLPDDHPLAIKLGEIILKILATNEIFVAATLPLKILPPQFNCYGLEQNYGRHIDGAIRSIHGTPHRIRTDLSATLFLSDPATYDGGELMIDDTFGPRQVKLAAGDMVVYSGTSVHSVLPVTRGIRLASFFWIQSLVRDDQKRTLLLELDQSIQKVATDMPGKPTVTELAGIYHNLLRMWADT